MMRFLSISLVLLFLCTGCSLKATRALSPAAQMVKSVENPYFSSQSTDYVYKMSITVYGRDIGGLLVIKNLGTQHYRLAMMTELGNTLLDMELLDGQYTLHKVSDALNKKVVLKTLKDDFRLMLQETYIPIRAFTEDGGTLYQTPNEKGFVLVRTNDEGRMYELIKTGKVKDKVYFTFIDVIDGIANHISIDHLNLKLSIRMRKIQS